MVVDNGSIAFALHFEMKLRDVILIDQEQLQQKSRNVNDETQIPERASPRTCV